MCNSIIMIGLFFALALGLFCLTQCVSTFYQFSKVFKFSKSIVVPSLRETLEHGKKGDSYNWFMDLYSKHKATFGIWMGLNISVFISDPDDAKIVLGSNQLLFKSQNYKIFEPWMGKGLLTSGGDLWHKKRKMLTPAFHFRMFSEFKQSVFDSCDIMIENLKVHLNDEPFDICPYISLLTLDVISETAMGLKQNAQLQSSSEYVNAVKIMCHLFSIQFFSIWKKHEFLFRFSKEFEIRKRALEILHGETSRVIALRKSFFKKMNISSLGEAEQLYQNGAKNRLAFLDILLLNQMEGYDLSDTDIRDEVDTFMFEGHDTTSTALSFTIYLLSQHSLEQQKAFEDAVAFKGQENESMKYLEAVIKESLRLYPPVPMYGRKVVEDLQLSSIKLPKGINVAVAAFLLHRNEKCFPEPNRFIPERFLGDANKAGPYAFTPFSAGPRNCIGQKFAMLELKCILASLLRTYEFLPVEGFAPQPVLEVVTRSKNGIQVQLRKR